MAHASPAVYLVWALLSTMLLTFLLFHLWSYDRFRCLWWNHGSHPGMFKRVMTYTYLLSVPLLVIFAVGFAIVKYNQGFTIVPKIGFMPTPYQQWSRSAQNAVLPLYLSYSVAWGLEMVTHLEELCFWLFLINSTSAHRDWFHSPYFKTWAVGSCIAILTIPLITTFTRENVYKCEAYTFLFGGIGSLSLTIWFLPILWTFPSFLRNLKLYEVDTATLVRLQKVHELNCIRVVFRFMFTIPFVILGADGVRPHQHINDNMFATDFLGILAGIGCAVSSGITFVIFFPRSIEGEMTAKEERRERHAPQSSLQHTKSLPMAQPEFTHSYVSIAHSRTNSDSGDPSSPEGKPPQIRVPLPGLPTYDAAMLRGQDCKLMTKMSGDFDQLEGSTWLQPNRRTTAGDVELGSVLTANEVKLFRARTTREANVSDLVYHWRSPIDLERPPMPRWPSEV